MEFKLTDLTLTELTTSREKVYFGIALAVSLAAWALMAILIIGLPLAFMFAIAVWVGNGLLAAQLKSECVQVNEQQLPVLFGAFKDVCRKLNLGAVPNLYILQAGGFLNAFATRHAGRDFVVLYSDIIEAYGQDSDEIKFLLGHELGHIKSRHIFKQIILFPGLLSPLLGPAYSRACEASCDRYGAFVTQDIAGAIRAMMILSGGKHIGKELDAQSFSNQSTIQRGFFVSWHELISGYPTLSQRVASLIALRDGAPLEYSRNPLAYFFALFTFGGKGSGIGNILIAFFMIGMLAAISIPNLLRVRSAANESVAKATLQTMVAGVENYAADHRGEYPLSASDLINPASPYWVIDYCDKNISVYKYKCQFASDNFEFTAIPVKQGAVRMNKFYATKDGLFMSEEDSSGNIERRTGSGRRQTRDD